MNKKGKTLKAYFNVVFMRIGTGGNHLRQGYDGQRAERR